MSTLNDQNIEVVRIKVFPNEGGDAKFAFVCFVHALVNGLYTVRSAAGPTADAAYTAAYEKLTQPKSSKNELEDNDLPF